jgi:hypothetical protein
MNAPSMCHEHTDPLQIAIALSDLSAELSSLSVGLDILQDDDVLTRRQQFLIAALIEKLSSIMTSTEEIARRSDDLTNAGGRL